MNHRDIAATLGFFSKAPRCPNFRLRLNVKRLCVIKLCIASSGRNRADHRKLKAYATETATRQVRRDKALAASIFPKLSFAAVDDIERFTVYHPSIPASTPLC